MVHSFLHDHPGCVVICTAPSQTQLEEVLWKEVERAHRGSRIPLGGRILKQPLKIDLGGGWQALAYSTSKPERIQGHHAPDLFAILDEWSGIEDEITEAIDSLNPSRLLGPGNPLRPSGEFYYRYQRAMEQVGRPDRTRNVVHISSLESPDAHLERSRRGLADKGFFRKARERYGEGSLWWTARILAQFPASAFDQVFPDEWVNRCRQERLPFPEATHRWMAIDLGGGEGGDETVLIVRDGWGILDCAYGPNMGFDDAGATAGRLARLHGVPPARIVFDAGGIGHDFGYRLEANGLRGCIPYHGGEVGEYGFANMRTTAAFKLRRRIDPTRPVAPVPLSESAARAVAALEHPEHWHWRNPGIEPPKATDREPQAHFAIPDNEWSGRLRRELQEIKYELKGKNTALEPKKDLAARLGHSPDFADALMMSFAFEDSL